MYKQKYRSQFEAWWGPLTLQGDPSHRYNLVGEAFDAGYEAGKNAALRTLGRKLMEHTEGEPSLETSSSRCVHPKDARSLTNRCLICDQQVIEQE